MSTLLVQPQLSLRTALVIGAGPIGTSVALALTAGGVRVHLRDTDPEVAARAAELGAGTLEPPGGNTDLAVVAVPPGRVGAVVRECQRRGLARHTLDVAGVKAGPLADVLARGCDPARHIGGHPLVEGAADGPLTARADLFRGRPWVLSPLPQTHTDTLNAALDVVTACGATPVLMDAAEHDRAVALVAQAPRVLTSLLAARLEAAPPGAVRLSETGVRPRPWASEDSRGRIEALLANAPAVADVLEGLAGDIVAVVAALRAASGDGTADTGGRLTGLLAPHGTPAVRNRTDGSS
ncbi:prephenate dehydrogenase/arogenate dehydrogenase family protein [Streptomyces sp. NPDC048442]|uniref:prephenate dehydrogenase/arogenate dehydrogenase family protein n=1 Tax=Streptomyces sp. NPDC048442 TaxID=3154823 RepID=UPI00344243BB